MEELSTYKPTIDKGLIRITALGQQFIDACVVNRSGALTPASDG
jgi:hypothetical protein